MAKAFRPEAPRIVVADLGTPTGKSIQLGTMLLAQGAVSALRNPVAHGKVNLSLAEAMEMVATLSLIARRVEHDSRTPFEATIELMDLIARDLHLRKKQAAKGWAYLTPGRGWVGGWRGAGTG
jgi:Protein of unknown function (Hypoth_ymh)